MNLKTLRCSSCQKTFNSTLSLTCYSFIFICPTCGNGLAELLLRKRLAGSQGVEITRRVKENNEWNDVYTVIVKEES